MHVTLVARQIRVPVQFAVVWMSQATQLNVFSMLGCTWVVLYGISCDASVCFLEEKCYC